MNAIRLLMTTAALFAAAQPQMTRAAAWCTGTVVRVATDSLGNVTVYSSWRDEYTKICNLSQAFGEVTPQICFAWFSSVGNAITYNKSMVIYYPSIEQTACATMPTETRSPQPGYVMLIK